MNFSISIYKDCYSLHNFFNYLFIFQVFTDLRLFDVHVKSAHTDVKDHFCDRCGKVCNFFICIVHIKKLE